MMEYWVKMRFSSITHHREFLAIKSRPCVPFHTKLVCLQHINAYTDTFFWYPSFRFQVSTMISEANPSASVLGQPWFLSVLSGLFAVLVYRLAVVKPLQHIHHQAASSDVAEKLRDYHTKAYTGVFLLTAVLVYGSFMLSFNYNVCKMMHDNIPIQTGGAAPF